LPRPPLFLPHTPVFSPLHYVRSRPTISCELSGCSHFAPRTTQIKTSGDALGQPKSIGWRKTGAWHAPDGTYTAVKGAIRVSVRPACRNLSLLGRYSKHKKNNYQGRRPIKQNGPRGARPAEVGQKKDKFPYGIWHWDREIRVVRSDHNRDREPVARKIMAKGEGIITRTDRVLRNLANTRGEHRR
jgi:hypothetical protein